MKVQLKAGLVRRSAGAGAGCRPAGAFRVLDHAAELHRARFAGRLGLVLLTGVSGLTSFGQAAFVGLGAYTTAVLTTSTALAESGSTWLARVAMARVVGGVAADDCGRGGARFHHAAAVWALPAARHYRVGNQPVLSVRYVGDAGRPHRAAAVCHRSPSSASRSKVRPRNFLFDLGIRARGVADDAQPARLARRTRDPRAEGRARDGRGDGRQHVGIAHGGVCARGDDGVRIGLAVCAHAALCEPDAIFSACGHRVPVHGGGRRCELTYGARCSALR